MNLIMLIGTILALGWLSTGSRAPGASPVPVRTRLPWQRRR